MIGLGELAGLGCGATWAITSVAMRVAADRLSPTMVNGLRCGFAAVTTVILVVALGRTGELATVAPAGALAVIASGVLGQGLGDLVFVKSLKMIGASRALPISNSYPLLTLALAMLFLGEQMAWIGVAGTILVIAGISLLAFPYGSLRDAVLSLSSADRGGVLAALGAGCLWALAAVVLRLGLMEMDLVVANFLRMATAAVLQLGLAALISREEVAAGLDRRSIAIMAAAGFLSAFTALMYVYAVYFAGAARASVLSSTSPLFGLVLSLFFLQERINSRIVAGTILSVAGIWLVLGG